jgi:hypothetical protein
MASVVVLEWTVAVDERQLVVRRTEEGSNR